MNVKVQLGLLVTALMGVGQIASAQSTPIGLPGNAYRPVGHPPQVQQAQFCPPPGPAYGPGPGYVDVCPPDSSVYAELLPQDRFAIQENEFDFLQVCREATRHTYFRVEYLNGETFRHDKRTLGHPLNRPGFGNINDPFLVYHTDDIRGNPLLLDPALGVIIGGTASLAKAPHTGDLNWDELSGIKAVLGVPIFKRAAVEVGFWGLEDTRDDLNAAVPMGIPLSSPLLGIDIDPADATIELFLQGRNGARDPLLIAIPITRDGQPGERTILYDADFVSRYSSSVWSMDVNMVYDLVIPGGGFTFQPILGYRHEEYGERLTFGGSFDNRSQVLFDPVSLQPVALQEPLTNLIDSKVYNYRDQVQIGFRSETQLHDRVSLGVEPKVGLGLNLIRSSVETQNAREPGDPYIVYNRIINAINPTDDPAMTRESDREIEFAPSMDVGFYANINVTEWFNFRLGYNFIWMGRLGVADDAIRLDETTVGVDTTSQFAEIPITESNIGLRKVLRDRNIGVFTVGGEIILP